jgi:hypothetical protein
VAPPSSSAAEPLELANTNAASARAIEYDVVEPTDEDPDGKKAGVFAKRGGSTFTVQEPWPNRRCLSVFHESDLDGDGLTDALIESSACSSYVQPTYFFVAGTMGDRFAAQELESGVGLTVETWRGRPTAVLESNNEGYNQDRPESVTRRFVFERGRPVMVDEQRAVEVVALANLRSEEFDYAKPDQEKVLWFDLDGDGKKDAIAGTLWQRWGRIMWQVRFADGRVSDGGDGGGCKRLGVLAEKTMGYHDLVCDFDARIQWDGQRYAPHVEK